MNKKAISEKQKPDCAMNKNGQLQLEAIVCFCAFLGLLAIMLHSVNNMNAEAGEALVSLNAKADTEFCCIGADALYSGSLMELLPAMPCSANENLVESSEGEKIKKTQCIAPVLKTVEREGLNTLEVTLNEHYR